MLEQTKTVRLTDLIESVGQEMHSHGYAEATIAVYEKTWRMLKDYMVKKTANTTPRSLHYNLSKTNMEPWMISLLRMRRRNILVG
jgi:hypothetical protein